MLLLRVKLRSDGTFSSGDGVAGLVDTDIDHDELGFPVIRGRVLKGLLVEECANILWSLKKQDLAAADQHAYATAAHFLFGSPGSQSTSRARMDIGPAQFPVALRQAVRREIQSGSLKASDILESLTTVRHQSAVGATSGAPVPGSLRAQRAVLRETVLSAELSVEETPTADARKLLAACVLSVHRGGTARTRGRGRLQARLWENNVDVTEAYLDNFPGREAAA